MENRELYVGSDSVSRLILRWSGSAVGLIVVLGAAIVVVVVVLCFIREYSFVDWLIGFPEGEVISFFCCTFFVSEK